MCSLQLPLGRNVVDIVFFYSLKCVSVVMYKDSQRNYMSLQGMCEQWGWAI